ncbi:MAG: hypothetical protein ITD33_05315, partial [Nitrosarchaeum sp.]|nr:hypothetical protein [Nitrosarchaeum sp.]
TTSSGGIPSRTISMSGKSFEWSFAINNQKSLLDGLTTIIPAHHTLTDTPIKFTTLLHDTEGVQDIEMVGLYLCLDDMDIFSNSDCYVEWYSDGNKAIYDPNGIFTLNDITTKTVGDKLQVEFTITFDKPLSSTVAIQSWDTERDFILRYIPDAIIVSPMIPRYDIPESITNGTAYEIPDDLSKQSQINKEKDMLLQKQKVADIIAQKLLEKQISEKARLESLDLKKQRLEHEKQIIESALVISQQRLDKAIEDSKQKILSMKQNIPDDMYIQIFAALEMETAEYTRLVLENTEIEKQKTILLFQEKKKQLYSLSPVIDGNQIIDDSGKINYNMILDMEKNRMHQKVSGDVISADLILLEKEQKEIQRQQKIIQNTQEYLEGVWEEMLSDYEDYKKSLETKKADKE